GESLDGRDEVLEPADGGSGQHAAEEEDDEPGCALADEIEETDAEVGLVECLEAAVLVDVLGGFFLDDVDDVVDGDDTLHPPLVVDDGEGEDVVFGEEPCDG